MKFAKTLITALGALAIAASASNEAQADTLKFGTLAPKQSIWGQVFQVWEKAVKKKSDEKLEIAFDYNGTQGDEGAMAGKIKAGQLDGAAVTAVGLSKFYKPVVAMQMPGVLTDWDKVDKGLAATQDEFNTGLKDNGARNLGWGFVGLARPFLKGEGASIKTPADLKNRKPYQWKDDPISPVFYQVIGVTPVGLNVPEVLPNLKTGTIDTVISPALAVEQLQWSGQLNAMSNQRVGAAVGAIIMNNARLEGLPADLRTIVIETGAIAAKALTGKIKESDDAAAERMKKKMSTFDVNEDEFKKTFKEVRSRLGQGTFTPELIKKLEEAAGL